jgi:hypothetical protein
MNNEKTMVNVPLKTLTNLLRKSLIDILENDEKNIFVLLFKAYKQYCESNDIEFNDFLFTDTNRVVCELSNVQDDLGAFSQMIEQLYYSSENNEDAVDRILFIDDDGDLNSLLDTDWVEETLFGDDGHFDEFIDEVINNTGKCVDYNPFVKELYRILEMQ